MMNLFDGCMDKALANGLAWLHEPAEWGFDDAGLTAVPPVGSDFFRMPDHAFDSACLLYKEVAGDFTLSTRVQAELFSFGDAAAITVRAGETQWAKLCMESSPAGDVSLVSVVTNPWSDDANGELLERPECHLRLTRKGDIFGMHYSLDGARWRFTRAFFMELPHTLMLGIHAQAPFKAGCRAVFSSVNLTLQAVQDFRSGE
jgi:regulation of enolase protein 1 (concanavalin A-like superfamily)